MFHRMKSEAPEQKKPQPQQAQQSRPAQQQPPQQPQAPRQEEPASSNEFSQYQRQPSQEQDKPVAKPAEQPKQQQPQPQAQPQSQSQQSQPQNQQRQEDAPTMNAQNNQTTPSEDYSSPRSLDIPAGSYRPGQQASARPGAGFPGAYPAAAYPAAPAAARSTTVQTATSAAQAEERTLTIGRGISISGEIEACDHIVVEGTVEAVLKGARIIDIAEGGTFYGTVEIDEAVVAGRFEGDITVHGRLTIRSTGVITGSISYKELEVEAGAVIDGRLTPAGAQAESRKQNSGKNNKNDKGQRQQSAANNDGGLFNTKAAAE